MAHLHPSQKQLVSAPVPIAYYDLGQGPAVVLVHGFASNATVNWLNTGWVDTLVSAGRRVVALDNRGHGASGKLYDPDAYGAPTMAEDVRRLMDYLEIDQADIFGYSMGARIGAFLALNHPDRVVRAIFGGLGYGMITGIGAPQPIIEALEAPAGMTVPDPVGRRFRAFAEQTRSDLKALAACMRASRQKIDKADVARISVPALVAVGTQDDIAGSPTRLAALLPRGEAFEIANRNHMQAVGDRAFKATVRDFIERPLP